ncbi:MAG: hypothetical protein R3E60_06670 [Alphaproteobacteria bacterium]
MAVYSRSSISERPIIELDGLTDDARKSYLISLAQEEVQKRKISGYIFNNIRFELSAHTDAELTRAGLIRNINSHLQRFSYVRPSPGADLVELTDANKADLIYGYFSLRQAYLEAEYDLVHEINTGRIKDLEALRAWQGWPIPESDRA